MTNKPESSTKRFFDCVTRLGIKNGFRCWRLQNRAIKDPTIVPVWIKAWRDGADQCDVNGEHLFAALLRQMADDCERRHQNQSTPATPLAPKIISAKFKQALRAAVMLGEIQLENSTIDQLGDILTAIQMPDDPQATTDLD